jgi:flavin-dependent dehydrogenase
VTDVFVVGGGPAGLAAAIAARQRGFDVLVTDCSAPPIDKACGEGIMPDGLAAARALGLELEGAGYPFWGIRFSGGGRVAAADFPEGAGMGLRRTVLHEMMLGRAAALGVRFAWRTPVTSLSEIRARWIVGADGGQSAVRRWANLEACRRDSRRFGFRRHYRIAPWSEYMQIWWGETCQLYITPTAANEVCMVAISRDPHLRLDDALRQFPEVARRLEAADSVSAERGAVTATRTLKAVVRGNVALVGDASGSVDAITGEGLCLLFQQSVALARAMESGDLAAYQAEHRRIGRRPRLMADMMLLLDGRRRLRTRALEVLSADPRLFARMLALHVGSFSPFDSIATGLTLSYRMLTV